MKKVDVKVGEVYLANVSGKRVRVQILREVDSFDHRRKSSPYKTVWDAKNTATGRTVRIKSAARLTPVS